MKKYRKVYRMRKILSLAFSMFIQLYWYKLIKKRESEWEELWVRLGQRFHQTLIELEGVLIKVGQFLSIRADLLPSSFINQIKDLVDKVPPSNWESIKKVIETEWDCPLEKHLDTIDKEAIASASIGEVYQAHLKDGAKVAVKVQRPSIESIIQTDFRSLAIIIWFVHNFMPVPRGFINFKVLYQELKQVIENELDFNKEMENLLYFQNRFKDMDGITIPKVYTELCTSKVLVMEWVDGVKITDTHALEEQSIHRKELAKQLINLFLPQWLEPGLFHADPHAGNILLSREGQIILLDFGMVGEISAQDAKSFQGLVESLLAKDYGKVVDYLSRLEFLLPGADVKLVEKLLPEMLTFDLMKMKGIDILAFKKEMTDIIQTLPIQVPSRFIFLGRSFVTVEGMLRWILPKDDVYEFAQPLFLDWLNKQGTSRLKLIWKWVHAQPLFKIFYSIIDFLQTPQHLENLKEIEQRRQFRFTMYENQKRELFHITALGFIGSLVGDYVHNATILHISIGVIGIGLVGYGIIHYKQKKWMRYMQTKGR